MMTAPTLQDTIWSHQAKAERMFAGAVWLDDSYARQNCGWLLPDLIIDDKIRAFWELVRNGENANTAAIKINAYSDILECINLVPTARDVSAFAEAISTDHYLRLSGEKLSKMAKAVSERDTRTVKDLAQQIATSSPESGDELITSVDVGLEFIATIDDIDSRVETTGLKTLDYLMGGFEQETLTLIGGRPGMGKTAFGLQICTENAKVSRRPMYFSLEMSRKNLWARIACGRARVSWRDIKAKRATEEQIQAVKDASSQLIDEMEDRLIVDDTANVTTDYIWRRVANIQPDLVVVDHLGLVNSTNRKDTNEVIRLGDISRNAKMMAKEFHIPVIYLVQLSRAVEMRDNKRPQLSDLRASGELEQDADNVLFLFRPDYYADENDPTKTVVDAEIIAGKIRDGNASFLVNAKYNLTEQHFYPVEKERNG